jgi:hypothetical protein
MPDCNALRLVDPKQSYKNTYEWYVFGRINETPATNSNNAIRARFFDLHCYLQELTEHRMRFHALSHTYKLVLSQRHFEAIQDVSIAA